ncbi:MAG: L-threonylcarbamoyladenylate synthase [Desulfobacterota bacterium]|nr:L-threonylcarbamoyladenylate synthase [Thermodesulfobacteriota bacterium]MDW8002426.1 L-threonylcarbamoyladenylate synthase [Deltaproteobacteria bacterium]
MIVEWNPKRPKRKITEKLREVLLSGGVIAYPTDTFYGLGCDSYNVKAIKKLYQIRKMDEKKAMSLICRSFKEISTYAIVSEFAFKIMKLILPGPYTVVLRAKKIVPKIMMTPRKEIGIRMPLHDVPIGLANLIDRPILNTTAKVSGEDVLTDPKSIERRLKGLIDIVIDGGLLLGSEPSTVVKLVDDRVEILRTGKGPIDLLPL